MKKIIIHLFCVIAVLLSASIQAANTHCRIHLGQKTYPCSVGRSGISIDKHEGDGATPVGKFYLRKVFYRSDKIDRNEIHTALPVQALQQDDGWCDDVNYAEYNKEIKLPFAGSHENLWLKDDVYDLIVVIGYNDQPVIKHKGSAIFLHIARSNYTPTAGCVAVSKQDLLAILASLTKNSTIDIAQDGTIKID